MYHEGDPYRELVTLSEYEESLVGHWFQAGTVQQTSAGIVSLGWQEIIAWATHFHKEVVVEMIEHPPVRHKPPRYSPVVIERCSLVDWELEQIHKLSQEYASEYSQASSPQRECPKLIFLDEVSEDVAIANANAIEDAFRTMFGTADNTPSVEAVRNS